MIPFYKDQVVLVDNVWRQSWELPGGRVDKGETAREAAIRECFEESGQEVHKVGFLAALSLRDKGRETVIDGALFMGNINKLAAFHPNEEIAGIKFWNETQKSFDLIDEALIRYARTKR